MSERSYLVVCIENSEYPTSLERRKIYQALVDADADAMGQIRVIDESGDDYLYPIESFIKIELPKPITDAVVAA